MRTRERFRLCAVRYVVGGWLVTCGLVLGTQALLAHHSGTMFSDDVKEVVGTIKEFQFTNPHSWIQVMVETKPGQAPQEWSIEWGSPNQLGRRGIRPSTFKPGAKVTLRIRPMLDGSPAAGFVGARFADGATVGTWEDDKR